ncbi:hypothetical protein N7450_007491 [Penicillium hetheringtonii]|uniref:Wax synthase domain-containing protein n=1 Tax=Penicillium hetheringtonii TaxID=911720 RepID=A0AAD6DHM0_9EURO|nr:hypothetical protein N7450_007491 [Penicillium hetheringtonii]
MAINWQMVNIVGSMVVQNAIPGVLMVATPKRSPYRFFAIPFMMWNASRFLHTLDLTKFALDHALGNLVIGVLMALNFLIINPLDEHDLAREMPTTFFRSGHLYHTFEIMTMTRGIRTPREVKNVPRHPAYYSRYGAVVPVGPFLLRQFVIMAWQFLIVDIFQFIGGQMEREPGFTDFDYNAPLEKWIEYLFMNIAVWLLITRALIDCTYRFASIIFVGLGLDEPSNWRPVFGRMKDAYTLRNYWGKFWHQFLRMPFTSISNFLARDVLHLPRPSILERYTNTFIVFFLSGVMHWIFDVASEMPWEISLAIPFFVSFSLGIMIEDGAQYLWNQISPPTISSNGEIQVPTWKKIVGAVWVLAWFTFFASPYLEQLTQLPSTDILPLSLGGLAVVGAVFVWFTFAPEV